jgi:membrane protease YdiL (CAAX protease family)
LFSDTSVDLSANPPDWSLILMYLPIFILGFDGLGEEVGWRGFALPRLLKKHSALLASLILGLLWGFWHLGYWLTPGSFNDDRHFLLKIANPIALAFIHTWIFTHARQSILLAILFHAINNTASVILANTLPFYSQPLVGLLIQLVLWVFVGLLLLFAKPYYLIDRLVPRHPRIEEDPIR